MIAVEPSQPKVERPRNSMRSNNRITMDLKSISSLFEENFNKYESLASNKSRQTISRKSLSYRATNPNPNSMAFEQYFQSLEAEPSEAERAEETYFSELEQQSDKRLRESEIKIARLQEELRQL